MTEALNPSTQGEVSMSVTLNALGWSFTGLAAWFVCCRLFTRLKILRNSGLDDLIIVISIVSSLHRGLQSLLSPPY